MKRILFLAMSVMIALTANAWNSGDYVYTKVAKYRITGADLVTNGQFTDGSTEGWTATDEINFPLAAVFGPSEEGGVVVQAGQTYLEAGMYQAVKIEMGGTYVVSFKVKGAAAGYTDHDLTGSATNYINAYFNTDGTLGTKDGTTLLYGENGVGGGYQFSYNADDFVEVFFAVEAPQDGNIMIDFRGMAEGLIIKDVECHTAEEVYDDRIANDRIAYFKKYTADGNFEGDEYDSFLASVKAVEDAIVANASPADMATQMENLERDWALFAEANFSNVLNLIPTTDGSSNTGNNSANWMHWKLHMNKCNSEYASRGKAPWTWSTDRWGHKCKGNVVENIPLSIQWQRKASGDWNNIATLTATLDPGTYYWGVTGQGGMMTLDKARWVRSWANENAATQLFFNGDTTEVFILNSARNTDYVFKFELAEKKEITLGIICNTNTVATDGFDVQFINPVLYKVGEEDPVVPDIPDVPDTPEGHLKKGDTFEYTTAEGVLKTYKVVGANLITNPSFENGTEGWTGGAGGALTGVDWYTSGGVGGGAYLRLTEAAGKGSNGSIGTAWALEKGKTYVFSYFIRQYSDVSAIAKEGYVVTSETNTPRGDETKTIMYPHVDANCAWTQNIVVTTAEYNYLQFCARWLGGRLCFDDFVLAEVEEVADPAELEQLLANCQEWMGVYDDPKEQETLQTVVDEAWNMLDNFENYDGNEVSAMVHELKEALLDYRVVNASDEYPVDVTARYLKNPNFDNGLSEWIRNNDAISGGSNVRFFEYFGESSRVLEINGQPLVNTYVEQTIYNLPMGYYRFTVQCVMNHFVDTSDPEAKSGAAIYCNGAELDMVTKELTIDGASKDASYPETFTIEGIVSADSMIIGFKGLAGANFTYVAIDNVKLEYAGFDAGIYMDQLVSEVLDWIGDNGDYLLPAIALALEEEAVLAEDALSGTKEEMNAAYKQLDAAFTKAKESVKLMQQLEQDWVAFADFVMETEYEGADAAFAVIDEVASFLGLEDEEASYDELDAMIAKLQQAQNDYRLSQEATMENPADYTFLVGLPNFVEEMNDVIPAPWYVNNQYTIMSNSDVWVGACRPEFPGGAGLPGFNSWASNFISMDVYQDIENLPNGVYTVSAQAITQSLGWQHVYATSSMGMAVSPEMTIEGWDSYEWERLTTNYVLVTDGKLRIGFASECLDGDISGWFQVTGFKLYYHGEDTEGLVDYYAMTAQDVVAEPSSIVNIPIELKNSTDVTAFQFDLYLPYGVSPLYDVVDGEIVYDVTFNTDRTRYSHVLAASVVSDGALRVVAYSTEDAPFIGNEGVVLNVAVAVDDYVSAGDYAMNLRNVRMVKSGVSEVLGANSTATLSVVRNTLMGDVNSDGKYSISDVVMVVNAVLEKPQANFNVAVADMNGDGNITMGDAILVLRLVLTDGKAMAPARSASPDAVPVLSAGDFAAMADGRVALPVALDNSEAYSAFQLDVVLPAGVELTEATLTGRAKASHAVAWNTLSDGKVRIVAYALDNAAFRGNEGALLNLVLTAAGEQPADATITLADGLFATVSGAEHRAEDVSVMMRSEATGVDALSGGIRVSGAEGAVVVESTADAVLSIYTMTGQLVQQAEVKGGESRIALPAGVYVINGNKITIK